MCTDHSIVFKSTEVKAAQKRQFAPFYKCFDCGSILPPDDSCSKIEHTKWVWVDPERPSFYWLYKTFSALLDKEKDIMVQTFSIEATKTSDNSVDLKFVGDISLKFRLIFKDKALHSVGQVCEKNSFRMRGDLASFCASIWDAYHRFKSAEICDAFRMWHKLEESNGTL